MREGELQGNAFWTPFTCLVTNCRLRLEISGPSPDSSPSSNIERERDRERVSEREKEREKGEGRVCARERDGGPSPDSSPSSMIAFSASSDSFSPTLQRCCDLVPSFFNPSFRALSGRLKFTVRRHNFNTGCLSLHRQVFAERHMLVGTAGLLATGLVGRVHAALLAIQPHVESHSSHSTWGCTPIAVLCKRESMRLDVTSS